MSILDTVSEIFSPNLYTKGRYSEAPVKPQDILGLPFTFTDKTDPGKRVFTRTMMENIPVVSIIPGKPHFLGVSSKKGVASDKELVQYMINHQFKENGTQEGNDQIMNWLASNFKKNPDFRYYGFELDLLEYFRYVQLMLSTLYVKMGLGTMFNFADDYAGLTFKNAALSFYFDKATSVTESADNSYGASFLDGIAKGASNIVREIRYIMGKDIDIDSLSNDNPNQAVKSRVEDITKGSTFKSLVDNLTDAGGVDKISTIMHGSNLLYPEVWQDSTFTRSYSLSFRFFSPYGDPASIFHHVYVPFICLLALTLPRQDTVMGYNAPFILRADCPGFFTCDMGVVTSLSYKKGGDDDLFSQSGLPMEITVNMSIKDLYPALMMSKSYSMLATNVGLAGFLDNMAGIYVNDVKSGQEVHNWLAQRINYVTGIPTRVNTKLVQEWAGFVQGTLNGNLKKFFTNVGDGLQSSY